jgi:uncharacterized protein YkwD
MRSSIAKRLALIAMIPATLLVVIAFASSAQAAAVSPDQFSSDIVTLTNQQRALNGCGKLVVSPALGRAALGHSTWMAGTGTLSHTGAGSSSFGYRVKAAGYARPLGENIAYGFGTGVDVIKAWMKSPGHRANILNCKANAVCVGTARKADGTPYWTQVLGSA